MSISAQRRAFFLAASALLMMIPLTGCAYTINGLPQAGNAVPNHNQSNAPTSTISPSNSPSVSTTESGKTQPPGKPTIAIKKRDVGYDVCSLLNPSEIAQALGAQSGTGQGCQYITRDPAYEVEFVTFFGDHDPRARVFDIRGNTAYQHRTNDSGLCHIIVMLTDDPRVAMPAFEVRVKPLSNATIDVCGPAIALTTKGFDRIPNA